MGKKRKRKQPPKPQKSTKLPTHFNCPYCNADRSIGIKMDAKDKGQGRSSSATVSCSACEFSKKIPIKPGMIHQTDIYHSFLDDAHEEKDAAARDLLSHRRGEIDDYDPSGLDDDLEGEGRHRSSHSYVARDEYDLLPGEGGRDTMDDDIGIALDDDDDDEMMLPDDSFDDD
ncbi:Transcription elongation factor 1 like protein [Aduncisulcus paluster]|uniref:Transcription elongation factor 1 homolog n=1 Tax=Aduncisulcus paluster TaxID=2918883 RepID=A0ABQ5KWN7_9EUKA|nr:Transcription elongation factor 1 like protein [Aduncisulcus paluster]|eukprot:gnl/Carplike_NY0171/4292_a5814_349.p1 GENE.gnl/Carplike_NY0171/4292_a5814_349~~gnl/Carplike_NY0171/4292_a5814_349.p1  ORF type:complete len:172 (+),score=46.66 gnl/Carplike_NY0171/4292_a5814_349:3-518(+)